MPGTNRLERVTAPPIATTGSPSELAVAKPVTRFEQPGPEVTNATPALPVMRPIPPAMNAAFCSWRQTTVLILESNNVSKTLSIFAPGMPKTYSTPCASRLFTSNPAPVWGWGVVSGGVMFFLLRSCEVRRRVPAQVGLQEILGFGQRDAIIALALDLKPQVRAAALEQVAAALAVGRQKVQVIAGHVE